MDELEKIMKIADDLAGTSSKITTKVQDILEELKYSSSVTIEIPWNSDISGEFLEKLSVVVIKIENGKVFFINPIKISSEPYEVKDGENKGFPRLIEGNGTESITLKILENLEKINQFRAIISNK